MRYSKREIPGLKTPKEIIVNSLSKYIKLLSSGNFNNYIFRGEPTNYRETVSSAFRNYDGGFASPHKEYPFIKMKNEFLREVVHKINQDEKNNFLAFAQHHGIPTNLVDFTTSPLVALYFACQPYIGNENDGFDKDRGFVYLLENKLINITDILNKNIDENILKLLIHNQNNVLLDLYYCFVDYQNKYPFEFYKYFKQLNDDLEYYFGNNRRQKTHKSKFPRYNNGEYELKLNYKFIILDGNKSVFNEIEKENENVCILVLEYVLYLQDFLKKIEEYTETVWWLNCFPNFIYTPMLSFERGRNQQGIFVYQAYLSYTESVYGTPGLSQQRVWADTIIVIEHKDIILKELDGIGINDKFIYGDFDNIAKYIKNKYDYKGDMKWQD